VPTRRLVVKWALAMGAVWAVTVGLILGITAMWASRVGSPPSRAAAS
jgi:hypothetical protein